MRSYASRLSLVVLLAFVAFAAGYVSLDRSIAKAGTLTIAERGTPPGKAKKFGGTPSPKHPGIPTGSEVGAGSNVYVVGTNVVFGGFGIHKWNGSGWNPIEVGATDITVDSDGLPWAVNVSHDIFHYDGSKWNKVPGGAMDIAACKGQVYITGTNTIFGGYGIYHWNGKGWDSIKGGGVRIAVGTDGSPWIVNSTNEIYHMVAGQWQKIPGGGTDIGAGGNEVWLVGTNPAYGGYGLYKLKGGQWETIPGAGTRIDVDSRGTPWLVNVSGDIYRWNGSAFDKLPGGAKDIGAE